MLHASYQKKSGIYKRYIKGLDDFSGNQERNIHREDEVVSTIIGPLDFFEPALGYRFWLNLLKIAGNSDFLLPEIGLKSVNIKLWPIVNHIEPDAHVTFEWDSGQKRILIIEFKWHADLSGDSQLHDQWYKYLEKTNRDIALHLFIAPDISSGIKAKNKQDIWGNRLLLISWLQVRSTLELLKRDESGLGRWAEYANNFLHRIGINHFKGFEHIAKDYIQQRDIPSVLFWQQSKE